MPEHQSIRERAEWALAYAMADCYRDGNTTKDWAEVLLDNKPIREYTDQELYDELAVFVLDDYEEGQNRNETLEDLVKLAEKDW